MVQAWSLRTFPWIAARVPERIDNLEKDARALPRPFTMPRTTPRYRKSVAKIYSKLRSTWGGAPLEDVAFLRRGQRRHRDYINSKDLMKGDGSGRG